jgi:hypothetical protein
LEKKMTQEQKQIASLELQLETVDEQMIDLVTANEKAKATCENIIQNLNGIGGVAKMVLRCHEMANDIQNFEAELAALNGEELNAREENVLLRRELENAVKCMETLLLDTEPALLAAANVKAIQPNVSSSNNSTSGLTSRRL